MADNWEYDIDSGFRVELKWRWIDKPISTSLNWIAHGSSLETFDPRIWKFSTEEGDEPTIVISRTDLRHDGYYSCEANYEYDGSTFKTPISSIHLNIRGKYNSLN